MEGTLGCARVRAVGRLAIWTRISIELAAEVRTLYDVQTSKTGGRNKVVEGGGGRERSRGRIGRGAEGTAQVSCIRTNTANTFLLLFATDCV